MFACINIRIIHVCNCLRVIVCVWCLFWYVTGVKFVRDCPREPHIPVYLIVGGIFGTIKMVWLLCHQITTMQFNKILEPQDTPTREDMVSSMGSRIASVMLTTFLIGWFALGNYWILSVYWPDSEPSSLYEPNVWCSRTLYTISFVHLVFVYVCSALMFLLVVTILVYQWRSSEFK